MAKNTKSSNVTLSAVVQSVATSRKINATDAGKRTRAYIRSHRADLEKVWPGLRDHSKGNRYPDMPAKARDTILAALARK